MPTFEPTILTLDSFLEDVHQAKERQILQNKVFSYTVQKYVFHHPSHTDTISTDATLSELRVFLDDQSDDSGVQHSSTVHYMEIIDENPNCMETMSLVAEDLLAKFDTVQDGWVILVEDGKSYRHLMNIKKQYSTALRKLLLFLTDSMRKLLLFLTFSTDCVHRYRASVTRLETPVIDVLSVLRYNYSNVAGINYSTLSTCIWPILNLYSSLTGCHKAITTSLFYKQQTTL